MFEVPRSDDDAWGRTPPAPADRLWRHPSEMAAAARAGASAPAAAQPGRGADGGHRFSIGTVMVAGSLGALAMFAALAASGMLGAGGPSASSPGVVALAELTSTTAAVTSPDGVVSVRLRTSAGMHIGAGVVVDRRGDLVTSLHVDDEALFDVRTSGADWSAATLVGSDATTGLTVLRVAGAPSSAPASVSQPALGETVQMVRPGVAALAADRDAATATRVTSTNATLLTERTAQLGLTTLTSPRRPGAGEVATDPQDGSVVALVLADDDNAEDEMTYAVPADLAARVARQIVLDGHAQHGALDAELARTKDGRLVVTSVAPAGHAAEAGLEPGDEVLSVSGRAVHTNNDVAGAMLGMSSSDTVAIVVRRDRRQMPLRVQVTPREAELVVSTTTLR